MPGGLETKGRWILFAVAVAWGSGESQWLGLSRAKCRWSMEKNKEAPTQLPCEGPEALCCSLDFNQQVKESPSSWAAVVIRFPRQNRHGAMLGMEWGLRGSDILRPRKLSAV